MLGGPVDLVQRRLGVPVSNEWDPVTLGAMAAFQGGRPGGFPMSPHGHPDPATLINLGYYDPIAESSPKQRAYLQGGEKPGTFGRDLAGAANQVPWWAWIAVGVGLMGLGYASWRRR